MRKRNLRVTKKHSVVVTATVRFGIIFLLSALVMIINQIASSCCTQLVAEKRKLEREIAKLEDARMRELSRWDEMKTPDKVEAALVRHGLRMSLPRFDQTIRVDDRGRMPPGQASLARLAQRGGAVQPASYRKRSRR